MNKTHRTDKPKHTERVPILFTPADLKTVEQAARLAGNSLSAYIRAAALKAARAMAGK